MGNSKYPAISYGGYRDKTRDKQPTVSQITEDLRILSAMNIKILRTYNVHLPQASNLLTAISALKKINPGFLGKNIHGILIKVRMKVFKIG